MFTDEGVPPFLPRKLLSLACHLSLDYQKPSSQWKRSYCPKIGKKEKEKEDYLCYTNRRRQSGLFTKSRDFVSRELMVRPREERAVNAVGPKRCCTIFCSLRVPLCHKRHGHFCSLFLFNPGCCFFFHSRDFFRGSSPTNNSIMACSRRLDIQDVVWRRRTN